MAVSIRTTARTAMMQALADDVGTNAYIRAYSGSVPATVGTALGAQTLLCELRGNATQFGTVASGVLTMSTMTVLLVLAFLVVVMRLIGADDDE